tara:strand:+ start:233 stop:706 length:474 start_codon:yes stop_codon:yes gene_type:complete
MKNLIKGLMLLTFIGALFASCEKENSLNEETNIETTSKNKSVNSKSGVTYIPQETFEEDLEDYMKDILIDNPGIAIMFNMTLNQNTSTYEVTNEPSQNDPTNERYRIVCRGDGGAVDKCIGNYLIHGIGYDDCSFDPNKTKVYDGPPAVYQQGIDCP